jgi:hypothetical protein
MSAAREPDQILEELGLSVERAWSRRRARPLWRRLLPARRTALAGAVLGLALVPTAVATQDVLFAPKPPALPPELRAPGAQDPTSAGTAAYVARGDGWKLSASACDYAGRRVVGVFLTVPGGGAGARCDGAAPAALAARRIHTYFDPQTGTSWIFGTLPAGAREVTVALSEGGTTSAETFPALQSDPRALAGARLPSGMRVLVASVPGAPEVRGVTAADGRGATVLRCEGGLCSP